MLGSRTTWGLLAALVAQVTVGPAFSQGTLEDYRRARTMLGLDPDPLIFDGRVVPHWVNGQDGFWYVRSGPEGKQFVLVDVTSKRRIPAFDHDRLASALTKALNTPVRPEHLPFESIELDVNANQVSFALNGAHWACTLSRYECSESAKRPIQPAEVLLFSGYEGYGQALTERLGVRSPDGRWEVLLREHNLVLRSIASGEESRLTTDGGQENDYTVFATLPSVMLTLKSQNVRIPPAVYWAPDSARFVAFRVDWRTSPRLTLTQSINDGLPSAYTYHAPVAGNANVARVIPFIFDVVSKQRISVRTQPLEWLWYGAGPFRPQWSEDSKRFFFIDATRGFQKVQLKVTEAQSGDTRNLIEETSPKYVNYSLVFYSWRLMEEEILWPSERDRRAHLYVYDSSTGRLKRRLTRGEWTVRDVVNVTRNPRRVYFNACGREADRDPYLRHLYSIDLGGGEPKLLTPEAAEHAVSLSTDRSLMVDSFSTVNQPWTSLLRDANDGRVLMEVDRGEPLPLTRRGWFPPEPFKAIAADGSSKLYGVIYRPSNFDPSRKYPVIESAYTWPSGIATPKEFNIRGGSSTTGAPLSQATAELGFVVVTVDARGTGFRSREFQEVSWKNLWGDERWQDHIGVLRQLARRYPYMDLERVGIFGHSGGGLDVVNAMLLHPDFYKVGVSVAGPHELSIGMALPTEQWMGYPWGEHYETRSNVAQAAKLRGKLLLVHGESDPNVHVSATLRLVQALIDANKDFDLLILPNQMHNLGSNRYLIRRRWDFFVRHLLGVDPPGDFDLRK